MISKRKLLSKLTLTVMEMSVKVLFLSSVLVLGLRTLQQHLRIRWHVYLVSLKLLGKGNGPILPFMCLYASEALSHKHSKWLSSNFTSTEMSLEQNYSNYRASNCRETVDYI